MGSASPEPGVPAEAYGSMAAMVRMKRDYFRVSHLCKYHACEIQPHTEQILDSFMSLNF